MPEHEVNSQKKHEKTDQSHGVSRLNSSSMSQNLMARDISSYLGETPFNPPAQKHALLLSSASPEERVTITRRLQQTYGNRYVQRLVRSMTIQPKLTVGAADDAFEHEADRVADQVMSMPGPSGKKALAQRQSLVEEEEIQTKTLASSITPLVQRQSSEEEDKIQTAPVSPEQTKDARGSFEAGSDVETRLQSQKGTGHPLSDAMRSFMEPRFGADFSGVRVHSDNQAGELNRELSAQAFTHGQDIYLGEGKNNPETTEGKKLLAHELTHVVQQSREIISLSLNKRIQRYAVPSSLACDEVTDWLNSNSPYAPNWAQTDCDYQFLGNASLTSKTLADGQVEIHITGNKKMTVNLKKKVDMPSWNPDKRPNRKAELDAWKAMIVELKKHEQEHAKIGDTWRAKLQELARNIDFTVTGQDKKEAMQKAKDEIASLQSQWVQEAQAVQNEIDPFDGAVLNCPASP